MAIVHASQTIFNKAIRPDWKDCVERELKGNILPFWIRHTVDEANGGFCGAVTNDLRVLNHVPRSAVLCARILWTYAAAYRMFKDVFGHGPKVLNRTGVPYAERFKVGPWECPYHHSRACFEMLTRLNQGP